MLAKKLIDQKSNKMFFCVLIHSERISMSFGVESLVSIPMKIETLVFSLNFHDYSNSSLNSVFLLQNDS